MKRVTYCAILGAAVAMTPLAGALVMVGAASTAQAAGGLKWVGLRVQYHLFINIGGEKDEPKIDTMSIELLQNNQARVCVGSGSNACQDTTYSQNNGVYSLGSNILGHYSIRLVMGGLTGEWRYRPGGPVDGRFILKSAS
jgi:hypothetical protein